MLAMKSKANALNIEEKALLAREHKPIYIYIYISIQSTTCRLEAFLCLSIFFITNLYPLFVCLIPNSCCC